MSTFLHALLGVICAIVVIGVGIFISAVRDMAREEIRDRMEHIPHAILHLAACRLDPEQRVTVYEDEWLPELVYFLRGDEARPVSRLFKGSWFAIGILFTARTIADRLDRPAPDQDPALPQEPGMADSLDLLNAKQGHASAVGVFLEADLNVSKLLDLKLLDLKLWDAKLWDPKPLDVQLLNVKPLELKLWNFERCRAVRRASRG